MFKINIFTPLDILNADPQRSKRVGIFHNVVMLHRQRYFETDNLSFTY